MDTEEKLSPVTEKVHRLIWEYAQSHPPQTAVGTPLAPGLTLRGDLAIDSLALVSLTIRLGEELEVDVVESGLEFDTLRTVGDLVVIGEKLRNLK